MPDANGQMYAVDHVSELQDRGFDGFTPGALLSFVNRGYFHVARKSQWYWERTTDAFTVNPGSAYVDLWPTAAGELPNFRGLDKLFVTTVGKEKELKPLTEAQFFKYLALDLTAAQNQGEPDGYYVYEGRLYILRPPQSARTFLAHYHRRPSLLTANTDATGLPITPIHLDEAIQLAAQIRAHKRALEPQLAQTVQVDLEEFFDDMRDDEANLMEREPQRVKPDDTWL